MRLWTTTLDTVEKIAAAASVVAIVTALVGRYVENNAIYHGGMLGFFVLVGLGAIYAIVRDRPLPPSASVTGPSSSVWVFPRPDQLDPGLIWVRYHMADLTGLSIPQALRIYTQRVADIFRWQGENGIETEIHLSRATVLDLGFRDENAAVLFVLRFDEARRITDPVSDPPK